MTGHRNSSLLRQRLHQLEYKETFNEDSIPLITHLLRDLISSTEIIQSLKRRESSLLVNSNGEHRLPPIPSLPTNSSEKTSQSEVRKN